MNIKIKNKNIDVLSIVLTILVVAVVLGVGVLVILKSTGVINHEMVFKEKNRYTLAEETIYKYILSYKIDCKQNKTEMNIDEMLQVFLNADDIVIRKCYINDNEANKIIALAVNVKDYDKYIFLISQECKIVGVSESEVPENCTQISSDANNTGYIQIYEYKKKILGPDYNITENVNKNLINVPITSNEMTDGETIELTTQIAINKFSENTLIIDNVENATLDLINITNNLVLRENILFALSTANEDDYCTIDIGGTYNNKNYINHLIISVKPENN